MLIDVTRLVQRALKGMLPTGVDRVSTAYVQHYAEHATALVRIAGHWVVLRPRDSRRVFEALVARGPGSARRLAWSVARGMALPARRGSQQHRVLINTGHSGLEDPRYSLEVTRRRLEPLYFAHDLIPISHPEHCRVGEDRRHRQRLKTMFDTGKLLVVNSQSTRAAVANYATAQSLRFPECVVAPLAPAPMPAPSDHAPITQPYFVVLGTIEPRKNHALLLHLWRRLVEEQGESAPRLVVIGQRGWKCDVVVDLLDRRPMLHGHVLQRSHCSDAELSTWLRHARALLFPSFAEGFGLPLVEALALGVPVLASNLPAFHEIAGAIPEYLDPLDGLGWEHAIMDYALPHSVRRQGQIERMCGYTPPSWTSHFELVDALIDRWQRRTNNAGARPGWIYVPRH